MNRIQITNNTHFVEFPNTAEGYKLAKEFRKAHKEFKGRHISKVLQMMPNQVEIGKVYRIS